VKNANARFLNRLTECFEDFINDIKLYLLSIINIVNIMNKKHTYPFTYKLDENINIHIEHLDKSVSCIWFDNNDKEEQNIPIEVTLYNYKDEVVNPFRNTQSFAISKDGDYKIKYNNETIIKLTTLVLLCIPAIVKNEIEIVTDDDDNNDY